MSNNKVSLRYEFKLVCEPIMKFLQKHYDPNAKVIVDSNAAELVIGEMTIDMLQNYGEDKSNTCKHSHVVYKPKGPHVGEYCALCDKWLRWAPTKDMLASDVRQHSKIDAQSENNDDESPF